MSHVFAHDAYVTRMRGGKRRAIVYMPTQEDVDALGWLDLAGKPRLSILSIKQAILPGITREERAVPLEQRLESVKLFFAY